MVSHASWKDKKGAKVDLRANAIYIIAHQRYFLNHLTELKASALANVGGVFLRGADREGVQKLVPPTAYFCDNTFLEHPVPTRCGAPGFKTETLLVGMNS